MTIGLGNPERIDPAYQFTQYVYVMPCPCCGQNCGVAGCAIWIRKCPTCFRANCPRCVRYETDRSEDGPALYPHEEAWGMPDAPEPDSAFLLI